MSDWQYEAFEGTPEQVAHDLNEVKDRIVMGERGIPIMYMTAIDSDRIALIVLLAPEPTPIDYGNLT